MRYPLPNEMTVRRQLSQFTVPLGFIDISTNILKSQAGLSQKIGRKQNDSNEGEKDKQFKSMNSY